MVVKRLIVLVVSILLIILPISFAEKSPDVNSDGCIDVEDLTIIGLNKGASTPIEADVNQNGIIDDDDYNIVEQEWKSASYAPLDACKGKNLACTQELCNYL